MIFSERLLDDNFNLGNIKKYTFEGEKKMKRTKKMSKVTMSIVSIMLVLTMLISALSFMQMAPMDESIPTSVEEIQPDNEPIEVVRADEVPQLKEKYADDYEQSNLMHTIPEEHQKLLMEQGIDWVGSCDPSKGQYIGSNGSYLFEIDLVKDTWVFYLENDEPVSINDFFDKAYSGITVIE